MTDKKDEHGYYYGYNLNENNDKSIFKRAVNIYKKRGLLSLIKATYRYLVAVEIPYIIFKLNYIIFNKYFYIDGEKHRYFIDKYNAINTERVIEIPFVIDFLIKNNYEEKRVLEVGNVLQHYFYFKHKIIDKYEKESFVDNIDIVDFNTDEKYDIIISISTLEHVGFDEPVKEANKSKRAIEKIIDLLDDNGIILITVPLRYNPEIDSIIMNDDIKFSKKYFLVRYSKLNLWRQTNMEEAMKCVYGSRYPAANSVAFLIYSKKS